MTEQQDGKKTIEFRARNGPAYEAVQARVDTPMTILAVILGIVLVVQYFADLSTSQDRTLDIVSWFIWASFVLEYILLLWLAPDRRQMVKTHVLDLFLILVPFLRPLRVLRLLRAFAGFSAAFVMGRRLMARRGMQWVLVSVGAIVVAGAALTMMFERRDPEAAIDTFGTALWWAIVTCTTVGYGDVSPITPAGQAVAVVLMIVGIALLSLVTANIASMFVEQDVQDENDELKEQMALMNGKLDQLLLKSATAKAG